MSNLQKLIDSKGIQISVEPGATIEPAAEWLAWRVHLTYEGRQLTVPFHKAAEPKGNQPTAAEVLVTLFFEASAYENTDDFKHFCFVLGFETDSQAEEIYKLCFETSLKLKDFLGDTYLELEDALEKDSRG
ncbi:MAG: hypothetical protein ACYCX4_11725 [Bacillota bacterium]